MPKTRWKIGSGGRDRSYDNLINRERVAIVVAVDCPRQGRVTTAFVPDANQPSTMTGR